MRVSALVRAVIFDTLALFIHLGESVIFVPVLISFDLLEESTLNDVNNNIIFHFELSSPRAPTCRISRSVLGISVCVVYKPSFGYSG